MRVIWKYPVPIVDTFALEMPKGAEVLTVQVQGGDAQMWALLDPDRPKVERCFRLLGTGHPLGVGEVSDRFGRYVGTFQIAGGSLVWHLFEEAEDEPL